MSKPVILKVAGPEVGLPLWIFIKQRMKLSGNEAKRLLDTRRVFVNQQRVWMFRHELDAGDVVEVHLPQQEWTETPIEVLWQDEHYLIINKPSGFVSNGPNSIEERLARELDRPVHAVHRLDRDTSGCMLLAWTTEDMEKMIPVFQRREVKKVYEGLVIGRVPSDLSVIERTVEGEEAVTLLKVLRHNRSAARVEFTLITGRTHQIRRHLNAYKLHLAGEKNYGNTTLDNPVLRTIKRHMLHAKLLGFPHPVTNTFVQARSGLPADYKKAAADLGV